MITIIARVNYGHNSKITVEASSRENARRGLKGEQGQMTGVLKHEMIQRNDGKKRLDED